MCFRENKFISLKSFDLEKFILHFHKFPYPEKGQVPCIDILVNIWWRYKPLLYHNLRWETLYESTAGIYRLWIFCNRPIKLIGLLDNMQSADCRSWYRFFIDSIAKTAWESIWHFIIFISSKLSVHFRHWKEAEVINNDYLINKRIYTFFTVKNHMPHY